MQQLVKIGRGEERNGRVRWLSENGYQGRISTGYPYEVIIIENNYFFEGNVTCFAAHTTTGNTCIDWEEWLKG